MEEKAKRLFSITVDLSEKIVRKLDSLEITQDEDFLFKNAMLFFFCKAYKSYQAIYLLWEKGFEEDAIALTRTLFELTLQSHYMKSAPKERALLFAEYVPLNRP
ncbi:MAG: DUF5677 domain-containing protein [Nitrospinota bacterium]